jgi:hypothetical protein
MGKWRSNRKKKARTEDGAEGGGNAANKQTKRGYQGKNVDAQGWIMTSSQHPQKRDPSNPIFEAFYKAQGVVPPAEWRVFMKTLVEPLPASFRINLDCDFAEL